MSSISQLHVRFKGKESFSDIFIIYIRYMFRHKAIYRPKLVTQRNLKILKISLNRIEISLNHTLANSYKQVTRFGLNFNTVVITQY